jgi:hypothetical protein
MEMRKLSGNILVISLSLCALFLAAAPVRSDETLADPSGTWEGNWSSEANAEGEGTFTARLVQTGSDLGGTLSIPDVLEKSDMPLKGSISGHRITFGDIDGVITFKGRFTSDSECHGKYEYPLLGDYGTWRARRHR